MFANSVISRSSISISSLLLSSLHSPPPAPRPLPFLSRSLFAYNLASSSMSCRLVSSFSSRFCASSECNLQASRRYALSRHIRPLRARSLSFSPSIVRPSRLSHLCPPRLSFILPCGSSVSVSSAPLHRPARRIRVYASSIQMSRSGSFSFPLVAVICQNGSLRRGPIRSLSFRLFSRVNSDISE